MTNDYPSTGDNVKNNVPMKQVLWYRNTPDDMLNVHFS